MNYKYTIVLLIFLSNFSLCTDKDQLLAAVGGYPISLEQFSGRYNTFLAYSGVKDNLNVRQSILNNMIDEMLLKYFDDNDDILNNGEYRKELEWKKRQTLLAFLKDREIYANLSASEEEIRDAFVKVNEKLAARHLYTETEEEANHLYGLLKIGVDFNYLAGQVFTDSVLKNNGGYLGYFSFDDMDPAFEETAYSLNVGEISKPVKTAQGYSIIKLEDRITNPLLTETEFSNKKQLLARLVKIRKKRPAESEYLSHIVDLGKVLFNEESISQIFSDLQENSLPEPETQKDNIKYNAKCAEYNKKIYTISEVYQWINDLPSSYKKKIVTEENLKSVIKGFILQEKLLQIAGEKKYDNNPEVLETFSKLENGLFLEYKKQFITDRSEVSEQEAIGYYNRNITLFSSERELNVQEIIVDNNELAENLMKNLAAGEDFGKLANEYSLRKWSAENGGELGFAPISRFGMLKDTLWNLRLGDLTGPLNIKDYFGIFKILGKRESEPLKFDEVHEKVISVYKNEQRTQIMKSYIKSLYNKVNIEINDQLLKTFQLQDKDQFTFSGKQNKEIK